jgi:hypothetical protein
MPIPDANHFVDQRLLAAVERGDLEGCRSFLDHGANPNMFVGANGTVLINAIDRRFAAGVMLLLDRGAKVDAINPLRHAPLNAAASRGDIETCRAVIERGANISAHDVGGDTPMHKAARNGHTAVCRMLLESGALIDGLNTARRTPLHIAVLGSGPFAVNTCQWLVEHGADPHFMPPAPREDFLTPMQSAAQNGRPAVMEFFLAKFPEGVESRTLHGKALDEIASDVNAEIVRATMSTRIVSLVLGGHENSATTPMRTKSFGLL